MQEREQQENGPGRKAEQNSNEFPERGVNYLPAAQYNLTALWLSSSAPLIQGPLHVTVLCCKPYTKQENTQTIPEGVQRSTTDNTHKLS